MRYVWLHSKFAGKSPLRRIAYAVFALAAAILFGTVGFGLIEGWSFGDSLYMAVTTVTTVGYGEVHPLSPRGRYFAIVFMIVGVATTGYALSTAVQSFVQSELVTAFGVRRRQREINKLTDHYIICGAGRIGARLIREMQRASVEIVVIERDAQSAAVLAEHGVLVLNRDATLDDTLREAGVEHARGLAACLPNDADNLYVVLTARDLNHNLHIVSRAVEEQAEPKLIRAGANRVVAPTIIGSHRMSQALIKPAVADFMDSITAENLDLHFEQVELTPESIYVGRELRQTTIRSELDVVIVAIRRRDGEMVFNPSGDMTFAIGDMLIAIGRAESLARLKQIARGIAD